MVLLHEGGEPVAEDTGHDCESLDGTGIGMSGPIVDIAETMTPLVDIMVTGHTHNEYVCSVPDPSGNPRMVTSASSYGRVFTEIDATYSKRTRRHRALRVTGSNTVVTRDVEADADQSEIIASYTGEGYDEVGNRLICHIGEDIKRGATRAEEFPLGSLIADAQLWNTADGGHGRRGDRVHEPRRGPPGPDLYAPGTAGEVTYTEVFTVQPFANYVVTLDLTGAQILAALQQQLPSEDRSTTLFLQVSEGFTYTWDKTKTGTDQIVADSLGAQRRADRGRPDLPGHHELVPRRGRRLLRGLRRGHQPPLRRTRRGRLRGLHHRVRDHRGPAGGARSSAGSPSSPSS